MKQDLRSLPLISAVLTVNAAGVLIKYLELDSYFILIGFRFHISLLLPFFFFFYRTDFLKFAKDIFRKPAYSKPLLFLSLIFLPLIFIAAVLFTARLIEVNDPRYFYELGLSSVFDFPLYLIWNLPQLFMLLSVLIYFSGKGSTGLVKTSAIIFSLFLFELIPAAGKSFNFVLPLNLILAALVSGMMIIRFQNIYWISITLFSLFWSNLLLFGSSSKMMVNLLLAAQFNSWGGFLKASESPALFILPVQLLLVLLILFFSHKQMKTYG